MERPAVLLALADDPEPYVAALTRAGMEALADPATALSRATSGAPIHIAVIDTEIGADDAGSLYASLHDANPIPTLLLLGADPPAWALSEEMNAAHDEFALKPIPPDALVYRLQALLIRGGAELAPSTPGTWLEGSDPEVQAIGEGRVVSIFAPKGGVGKTTLAVNMAVALRQQSKSPVLLLDADAGVGNVTSVLEVPYHMGLADLADSPESEWTDAAFEHATATHAASGVRVLTWGHDPAQSERVTADLLLTAVRWARSHHAYVVIDTHPGYDDRTVSMLTVANEIFLVVTPEVGAIRNSSQFLAMARDLGLGDVVKVIVNRSNHGVAASDIVESLGLPISATIVSDGRRAVTASNEGIPVITKYPRERISSDLHEVARLLTAPKAQPVTGSKRAWWSTASPKPASA